MQNAAGNQTETGRAVVVSIHDVSPFTQKGTEGILRDLAAAGVPVTSLLVIPDHHGRGGFSGDPEFCRWLRSMVDAGHEAVAHGFRHLRVEHGDEGMWEKIVTRSYTAGEGEFFDLSREDAAGRLAEGRRVFAAAGLNPCGFIAPAWLLGPEAEGAVSDAGFRYTTRITTVVDFHAGKVHVSRSLVWSVRAGWRRLCSLAWNRFLFARDGGNALLRIGIHPPDWEHAAIRRQILDITRAALAGRVPMTYETWVKDSAP